MRTVGHVIGGQAEPGFGAVADAFAANFEENGDIGAAVCVYADGRPVVDLWGGVADPATGRKWDADTLVLVFSCTKGVSAVCANLLVERGQLDPRERVAHYWPEFASAGKDAITVEQALSHQAGVPLIEADLTLDECLSWEPVVRALELQPPIWEPGTAHGYHMRTYGWVVGELVRRVTGSSIGSFWRREIAEPFGLDFWIGLPAELEDRVAPIVPPPTDFREMMASLGDDFLLGRVATAPGGHFHYDEMWNSHAIHGAELPSTNGIGDARALARLYAGLIGEVEGRRVLAEGTVREASTERVRGPDRVIMLETAYGLGFMLAPLPSGAGPRAFGHAGAGGSVAFTDPDRGLSIAYVMNAMRFDPSGDSRAESLVDAAYGARGV